MTSPTLKIIGALSYEIILQDKKSFAYIPSWTYDFTYYENHRCPIIWNHRSHVCEVLRQYITVKDSSFFCWTIFHLGSKLKSYVPYLFFPCSTHFRITLKLKSCVPCLRNRIAMTIHYRLHTISQAWLRFQVNFKNKQKHRSWKYSKTKN